ncbi:hypothetical protein GCM10009118_00900 [Wandonia haliotis]|uniref:PKD domain-containing protein n=2 Tax=Wandonia haliotis TaxID=574963 RepID=A0ABP3XZ59_9FLAO
MTGEDFFCKIDSMKKKFTLFLTFVCLVLTGFSQQWVSEMLDGNTNFYEVRQSFEEEWSGSEYVKGKGWKQFKRWEYFMEQRVYPSGDRIPVHAAYFERNNFVTSEQQVAKSRSATWQPMGPFEWSSTSYNPGLGRVNTVAVHPGNNQVIYVGTPSGGLWKTTNGGTSWVPLTDDFSAIGISGIVINPYNPDEVYVATGDGDGADTYSIGVLKSTDGGATWSVTGLVHTVMDYIVCRRMIMHPTDPLTILVATNVGVFKTVDGGNNWYLVATGSFRDIEFQPGNANRVYASSNRLYISENGGETFAPSSAVQLPQASVVNRMEIAVSPDQPDYVYVLCGKESDASFLGLYRSENAGTGFSLRTNSPNLFTYDEQGLESGGQSWYDMAIAVDPDNADNVFVGGINIWKSTNGGSNFQINTHWIWPGVYGYTHADIHFLAYDGSGIFCGSDGGIFYSGDQGASWEDLSSGMQISQFYRFGNSPLDAGLIIGGTQDNGSKLGVDQTWTHVMGGDGMEAAVNPTNPQILFCTQQYGYLNRSLDGGMSWELVMTGNGEEGRWVTPFVVLPVNKVIMGYENVWLSQDNGSSFTQISNFNSGETIREIAVAEQDHNVIYAALPGHLYKTTDGGTTWTDVMSNLPDLAITDIQIHPLDSDVVYLTTSGYNQGNKVFVSDNGGVSWQNISGNLPNLPANTLVLQRETNGGVYVGMDVGIYYIDSTLGNWAPFDDALPNVIVSELEIHYPTGKIRAATFGRGVWESDLFSVPELEPIADFSYLPEGYCVSDPIVFYDASLYASPSWQWYFPGGVPATSTAQSPSVQYTVSGEYIASLVVQNQFGTDSIAKTVTVIRGENALLVELVTDDYPEETAWTITDNQGQVWENQSGYSDANTAFQYNLCLPAGCYTFRITDAYSDGICCDFGTGSYSLVSSEGVIATGGTFGSEDVVTFCFDDHSGVKEEEIETLLVYPNPTNEKVMVVNPGGSYQELYILDLLGRKLATFPISGKEKLEIDLSVFSEGTYLFVVHSRDKTTSHRVTYTGN